METRQDFYSSTIKNKYNNDYRTYVLDCLDQLINCMGTDNLLDALTQALDIDTLGNNLEYISRSWDLDSIVG